MCCTTGSCHGSHGRRHPRDCGCGCLDAEFQRPRFMSKARRIERLEKHLEDLQDEVKAVREHIAEIKKAN
jgi:hypothetical protein